LKIHSAEFVRSAVGAPDFPRDPVPQVAFVGRSNVGKSSLINRLLGRTRTTVARVSSTPGKTQQINFYRVKAEGAGGRNRDFYLVDLPGYGFARVPASVRSSWRPLIERYLSGTRQITGVVQLIDIRHEPTVEDRRMLAYLASLKLPVLVALTKADKLGNSVRAERRAELAGSLGLPSDQVLAFSAVTGEGRTELLGGVDALLSEARA
jgi:GTP-binding protein